MLFDAVSHYLRMCFCVGCHELSGEVLIKINGLDINRSFTVVFLCTLPLFVQGFFGPYLAVMVQSGSGVHHPDPSTFLLVFGVDCEACCVTPRQYKKMGLY